MGGKRTSRSWGREYPRTQPVGLGSDEGSGEMKIAVIGRGNVGGGLADLWEKAGHEVMRIGKEGGDVSEVDAVLVAVPGGAIEAALDKVQGLQGKTAIDATNLFGADRPTGFQSNAEFVKSRTNGPTAKSFNVNFANQYGELRNARSKPGNIWTGDEEAREVVEDRKSVV